MTMGFYMNMGVLNEGQQRDEYVAKKAVEKERQRVADREKDGRRFRACFDGQKDIDYVIATRNLFDREEDRRRKEYNDASAKYNETIDNGNVHLDNLKAHTNSKRPLMGKAKKEYDEKTKFYKDNLKKADQELSDAGKEHMKKFKNLSNLDGTNYGDPYNSVYRHLKKQKVQHNCTIFESVEFI